MSEVVKFGVSFANVHVAPLRSSESIKKKVCMSHQDLTGHTYTERFNTDDPNNEGANVGCAAVDNGVVLDFYALCPAGIVSVIMFARFIISQGNSPRGNEGVG